MTGTVYLVGAGPGDPGLLTLAARDAIAGADVILHDALSPPEVLAYARPGASLCDVGKRGGELRTTQDEIIAHMLAEARNGRRVVRLKGGDPFVFGRGSEEAEACRGAGIPFVVIPGITSAIAGPAYAGIPVTHRGMARSFAVVTGTTDEGGPIDWARYAAIDTLVILMGARNRGEIAAQLIDTGRLAETPAAVIQWATTPRQRSVTATLATIDEAAADLGPPALLVVGETAALAGDLAWFTPGPLAGRTVVATISRSRSDDLARELRRLGATVLTPPAITVTPAEPSAILAAVTATPVWIVLPSRNAVAALAAALDSPGLDARALAGSRVASLGPGTTEELRALGIRADFQPSAPGAEAMAAEIPLSPGDTAVLLQSNLAPGTLQRGLEDRGATVTRIEAYRTMPAELSRETLEAIASADAVTFASPSAVDSVSDALSAAALRLAERTRLVAIGPTTSAALDRRFGCVDAVANDPDPTAVAAAVVEALA